MVKPLQRLTASTMPSVRLMMWKRQGGKCLVCSKPINVTIQGTGSDYALDHCHESGEVRGLLHRSCNSALGKIDHAAGCWGAKSMKYEDIIPYLKAVVAYYEWVEKNPTGMMYPSHKTPEQKKEADRLKRNKAAALKRAKDRVKRGSTNV